MEDDPVDVVPAAAGGCRDLEGGAGQLGVRVIADGAGQQPAGVQDTDEGPRIAVMAVHGSEAEKP